MYDPVKLKTVDDCRTVMARAKKGGLDDVYQTVFRRYCELSAIGHDDPSDPLVREFFQMLAAYEQLLTEKNGRTTAATRTRQKLSRKGVHLCLIEWTRSKAAESGATRTPIPAQGGQHSGDCGQQVMAA